MAIADPRDLEPLLVWCSAEAETGYADGAPMTQWTDLSGNGNHLQPTVTGATWSANLGDAGAPAVVMPNVSAFTVPLSLLTPLAGGGEAVVTHRPDALSRTFWALGDGLGNNSYYMWSDGFIYDSFGRVGRLKVATAPQNTWHAFRVASEPGLWRAWINGTLVCSETPNTVGWPLTPSLGGSGPWGLFLLFSRPLTDTERADLDVWVAANPSGGTLATPPGPPSGTAAPGVASQTVRDALGLTPAPVPGVPHFFTWQNPDGGGWAHDGPRSDGLIGYTITHGRREPLGRPAPAVVTVTMLVPIGAPSPEIGDRFRLTIADEPADLLGLALADRVRATAKITDTESDPTYLKILPGHGPSIRHTVTATAMIARQQVALFDGRAWPIEPAGARAERVLDWLGLAGTIDAGGPDLAAPETVQNVGAAMTAVIDSTGCQFVDQRDGTVDYHGREHRRGTPVVASLTSAELLALNFVFRKSVGEVINRATITLADGETQVIVADAFSEDPFTGPGPYPTAIATMLTDEADAAALATLLVSRRARPSYQLPAVTVDLSRSIDTATLADVLTLRAADKIAISGMPAGSPWDALPNVYVEGYTETAAAYAWRLSLVVSDPLQTGPALRWIDVPAGVSWDDVRNGFRWIDAARTDNPADLL